MPDGYEGLYATATGHEPGLGGMARRGAITGCEPELSGLRARAQRLPLILHSDDEPALLVLVALILERGGYRVEGTVDPYATLDVAERLRPDLILTDLMKPRMSGLELLSRLKGNPALSHIPVVILSACATPSIVSRAREMGAADFIAKPCGVRELLSAVAAALGKAPPSLVEWG